MSGPPIRVRMAPSPTGFVHLGSAHTALFNLLFARSRGGTFVLRVEDTDLERNREEFERGIYEGFHWLGLEWDEGPDVGGPFGPYRQSERLHLYRADAVRLLESGAAYRCFCTVDELAAEREAARRRGVPYRYSRRCLTRPPAGRRDFTVRFRIPDGGTLAWRDLVRGEISFELADLGDFVCVKSNGWPTYNFANVVDDSAMEISHVLRAEEHISNTPLQMLVYGALDRPLPEYGHLPWVLASDRSKLSKRKHPEAGLSLFQERGYLPEAMLNYLALLGWNPGTEQEVFTYRELVRQFSLQRVQRAGAVFDWDKLDWLDGHYIRSLALAELAARLRPFLPELDAATVAAAAPALQERMVRLSDARDLLSYLWAPAPPAPPEGDALEKVRAAAAALAPVEWSPAAIEAALDGLRTAQGWSRNQLFKPVRQAVTGRAVSPPIHHTLALLPKAEVMRRLGATG
ncbi:MAG: glutamate--tRNA ligase [Candidatus Dormibacterales bacterium]